MDIATLPLTYPPTHLSLRRGTAARVPVLNCTEKLHERLDGKTHECFSSVPRLFADTPYDHFMKSCRPTTTCTNLRVAAMA